MSKKTSDLRIASISDIHLFHGNTPTVEILRNLRRDFPDTEVTGELDVIFIVGDVFDKSVQLSHPDVIESQIWVNSFLRTCKKRDIVVVVLEGTGLHDWKQSRMFETENINGQIGADLHYVTDLSILHLERWGVDVLCVPDEWRTDNDVTWGEVETLLAEKGLAQVDYTLIHGSFPYQLPPEARAPVHLPERYLSITRHYVFSGHIHQSNEYRLPEYPSVILTNGSYDRIAHGEEKPKGHWRVHVKASGLDAIVFVENVGAKLYKTINCKGLTVEDALEKLKIVETFPDHSHVRIAASRSDPILSSVNVLRVKYPKLHWTTKSLDREEVTQPTLLVDMRDTFVQLNINSRNITELLMERIRRKTQDARILAECERQLGDVTNA